MPLLRNWLKPILSDWQLLAPVANYTNVHACSTFGVDLKMKEYIYIHILVIRTKYVLGFSHNLAIDNGIFITTYLPFERKINSCK